MNAGELAPLATRRYRKIRPKGQLATNFCSGGKKGMISNLPRPLILLGLSGILPQAACLGLILAGAPWQGSVVMAACYYAAVILSFLGGLWWMAGLLGGIRDWWIYALAVAPSLIGWGALLPLSISADWLHPALIVLGLSVLVSPIVDQALARHVTLPQGWLRLRAIMAGSLGTLTLAIALVGAWSASAA